MSDKWTKCIILICFFMLGAMSYLGIWISALSLSMAKTYICLVLIELFLMLTFIIKLFKSPRKRSEGERLSAAFIKWGMATLFVGYLFVAAGIAFAVPEEMQKFPAVGLMILVGFTIITIERILGHNDLA